MKLEVIVDCIVNQYFCGDLIGRQWFRSGTILRNADSIGGGEYEWRDGDGYDYTFNDRQVVEVF